MSDKDDPVLEAMEEAIRTITIVGSKLSSTIGVLEKAIAIQKAQVRVIGAAMDAADYDTWIARHVGLEQALAALDELTKG